MLTDKGLCHSFNAESISNLFWSSEYIKLLEDSLASGLEEETSQ